MNIIKLNENFNIRRDSNGWTLTTRKPAMSRATKDKPSVPIIGETDTYYGKLEDVCKAILDRACGNCHEAQEILDLLEAAQKGLLKALERKTS